MAFYDDMADVATELLTEFGRTVTFERITDTFNPVTGKDTARTTTEFTPVGVEVPINKALIDGTRVQIGDRFLTIDAATGYVPEMSDRLQDSPFTGYAIAMEPGARYLPGLPSDADVSGQTVSKTAPVGGSAFAKYSGKSTSTYDITGWDGHYRAFEFRVDSVTSLNGNDDVVEVILNEGSTGGDSVRVKFDKSSLLWSVTVNGVLHGTTYAGTVGGQIGIWVHAQSGDVGIAFASTHVDKLVIAALGGIMHGITTIGIDVRGFAGSNVAAGDEFSATIVSNYVEFERTYPVTNMRDWGGTLISSTPMSESWAIVNIEPISPAGTPVAYRLQVRK